MPLAPGDELEARVGGQGGDGIDSAGSANGGLNGGGNGAPDGSTTFGGGGGGGLYGGGGADSLTASGGGGGGSGLVPDVMGESDTGVREGNGEVVVTWTPCDMEVTVEKTVTGDDPGVAFPVEVTCEATFNSDTVGPGNPDADILLTPTETSGSTTVEVKNGEVATVVVSATASLDTLDCTAEEQSATLPTGYSCASPKYVPDANPYFWDEWYFVSDSEPVEVVNACVKAAAPVQVNPTFTG